MVGSPEDCCFRCCVFHVSGVGSARSLGTLSRNSQDACRLSWSYPGRELSSWVRALTPWWALKGISSGGCAWVPSLGEQRKLVTAEGLLSCPAIWVLLGVGWHQFPREESGPRGDGQSGSRSLVIWGQREELGEESGIPGSLPQPMWTEGLRGSLGDRAVPGGVWAAAVWETVGASLLPGEGLGEMPLGIRSDPDSPVLGCGLVLAHIWWCWSRLGGRALQGSLCLGAKGAVCIWGPQGSRVARLVVACSV